LIDMTKSEQKDTRIQCPHCGVRTWQRDYGAFMRDHDRPDGKVCRKAQIQVTDRLIDMTNTNSESIKIRIVKADGSWRFNRLTWTVGDERAYFEHGGFVILRDMYKDGCEMKEGWV